ncbi:MAG: TrmH family RNA methyltransferase [Bradymonadales bacterium]
MSLFNAFRVVLVEPQNPINLGTVMRAMKNMGFSQLALVGAPNMDLERTQIPAHRTRDMLESMQRYTSLDDAIAHDHVAYGFTARERSHNWESLDLESAATQMLEQARSGLRVSLVFGREQSGLDNEELERCTVKVRIATSDYSSLNLAQAVLLACYEVSRNIRGKTNLPAENTDMASLGDRMRLMQALSKALVQIGFFKSESPNSALHRLHQSLHRFELRRQEVDLLLGICREIENYAKLLRRGISPKLIDPEQF